MSAWHKYCHFEWKSELDLVPIGEGVQGEESPWRFIPSLFFVSAQAFTSQQNAVASEKVKRTTFALFQLERTRIKLNVKSRLKYVHNYVYLFQNVYKLWLAICNTRFGKCYPLTEYCRLDYYIKAGGLHELGVKGCLIFFFIYFKQINSHYDMNEYIF